MKDWGPERMAKLAAVSVKKAQARLGRMRTDVTLIEGCEDAFCKMIVCNLGAIMHADVRRIIGDLATYGIRKSYHANRRKPPL